MFWFKFLALAGTVLISSIIGYNVFQNQRQICQPNTYVHQEDEKKKHQCSICLKENNSSEAITLICKHTFCFKCLKPLISGTQTSCCCCRKELDPAELEYLKYRLHEVE